MFPKDFLLDQMHYPRPNGIVGGSLENRDPAEDGVVDFEVSRGVITQQSTQEAQPPKSIAKLYAWERSSRL